MRAAGSTTLQGRAGYAQPDELDRRLLYLLEGAVVVGGARRDAAALNDAEQIIRDLLG